MYSFYTFQLFFIIYLFRIFQPIKLLLKDEIPITVSPFSLLYMFLACKSVSFEHTWPTGWTCSILSSSTAHFTSPANGLFPTCCFPRLSSVTHPCGPSSSPSSSFRQPSPSNPSHLVYRFIFSDIHCLSVRFFFFFRVFTGTRRMKEWGEESFGVPIRVRGTHEGKYESVTKSSAKIDWNFGNVLGKAN